MFWIILLFLLLPAESPAQNTGLNAQVNSEINSEVDFRVNPQLNDFNNYIDASATPTPAKVPQNAASPPEAAHTERAEPPPPPVPHEWRTCTTDRDCAAAVTDCMTWGGLNKKYLKKIVQDLESCSLDVDPGFQPQAACVDKMCQTTGQMTDVSWEEWLDAMQKQGGHEDKINNEKD